MEDSTKSIWYGNIFRGAIVKLPGCNPKTTCCRFHHRISGSLLLGRRFLRWRTLETLQCHTTKRLGMVPLWRELPSTKTNISLAKGKKPIFKIALGGDMLVPRRVSAHPLKFSDACKPHTWFFGPRCCNVFSGGARCCETSGAFCWHLLLVGWQRGCALGYAFRGAKKVNEKAEGWVLVLQQMCKYSPPDFRSLDHRNTKRQNTKFLRLVFRNNLDQSIGFIFSPAFCGCHDGSNTGWPPRVRLRGLPFGAHEVRIATKPLVGHLKWVV